ncbi:DUF305 domain-containing protein [Goodfellowiella coeruleoviolacea]|uniref:Uncharacterized conserved protein, DUF305 family n=1 Tax=Goodfellowiella coeruleoviolacea TaxID=334858 RepID=A0AAE3GGH7_9PSEU|nr:DUF305 domain-containing protein [Goodfellowiella coeruleoviolacea]MCP2166920.1 Uncharacterized conserved protein, DUF305 family [Goodfellowiella coeruleoviolacea]
MSPVTHDEQPTDPRPGDVTLDTDRSAAGSRAGTATRTLVMSAAVVAVLLLGATVGLLIRLPFADSAPGVPAADSVDVGFCQDMSQHHLQGVQMANAARERSTDPEVRQLAFDIESTQQEQVGRMKGWLSLWNQPDQVVGGQHMAWMAESGGHGHSGATSSGAAPADASAPMPGMATGSELARLRSLSGRDFDVYFLQLMLRHHQGGAPMADYAAKHASQSVVRTLADNMLKSQGNEVTVMTEMLRQRGAEPLQN